MDRRIDDILYAQLEKKTQVKDDDVTTEEQQELIEHLIQVLLEEMVAEGYTVEAEEFIHDVSFLYEVIKSFVLKMHDEWHPIQDFADQLYLTYFQEVAGQNPMQLSFDF